MCRKSYFAFLAVVGCSLFLLQCSGQLLLSSDALCSGANCYCTEKTDCGAQYDCIDHICTEMLCLPGSYSGFCASGRECVNGICLEPGEIDYCNCKPEQGCRDGVCIDINDDNQCGLDYPIGYCGHGSVCLGGECIEITTSNACSIERPNGYCAEGAVCVDGYCQPITDYPCLPNQLDGYCVLGQQCVEPGICDYIPCGKDAPTGRCDIGLFCGAKFECIKQGTCDGDTDCLDQHTCENHLCVRDTSCQTTIDDCLLNEHCTSRHECLPLDKCYETVDCDGTDICSSLGNCIAAGTCETKSDCAANEKCGSANICLGEGECSDRQDCPPGYGCISGSCVVTGDLCNYSTATSAIRGEACPTAGCVCEVYERCSSAGSCIFLGKCVNKADCIDGYYCNSEYNCQPESTNTCKKDDDCDSHNCSITGGCIPANSCVKLNDCDTQGTLCSGDWECVADATCGSAEPVTTTRVAPNMLIVLDRSGSMYNEFVHYPYKDRWTAAKEAISSVLSQHSTEIRFGLSLFPDPDGGIKTSGTYDVPVNDNTSASIITFLNDHPPCNNCNTPTRATIDNVKLTPGLFGVGDLTRENYVLLVTDGQPNCEDDCDYNCASQRLNAAINSLHATEVNGQIIDIKTYVIGLNLNTSSYLFDTLNCAAVYGHTNTACGITTNTCDYSSSTPTCTCSAETNNACFAPANDLTALNTAFDNIAGQIASCNFALDTVPADASLLYVYENEPNTPACEHAAECLIEMDATNGWTYVSSTNQIVFHGSACDNVKSGNYVPYVIYGCAGVE
ncbi:MAG: hypothetical protein JW841_15250 [Deltaproteobacteria bacterium]|nr:hypothetical protein [Deltaproteobacteria bacterium]